MTQLFIALDGLAKNEDETLMIAEEFDDLDSNFGFKINLDYVLKAGLESAILTAQSFHKQVFLDLKIFNGSRTMADIAAELAELEVDYFNVHALADKEIVKVKKAIEGSKTKLLGVTVLTHFDDEYCQLYFKNSLKNTAALLASRAIELGCDGVIIPGTVLDVISNFKTIKVVPGVRPHWYKDSRHSQAITPKEAQKKGADIIVCGSPIMNSFCPVETAKKILEEIS
ncbi:MAG: orotidine 5'-phosphate decarboxylase / HUMPS family protein [Patescibacteria group bacterium]|mgnify:CR=1 FL=1